jgi:hypothetical protein
MHSLGIRTSAGARSALSREPAIFRNIGCLVRNHCLASSICGSIGFEVSNAGSHAHIDCKVIAISVAMG